MYSVDWGLFLSIGLDLLTPKPSICCRQALSYWASNCSQALLDSYKSADLVFETWQEGSKLQVSRRIQAGGMA